MNRNRAVEILRAVRHCASTWRPDACLVGNVRAGDIVGAIDCLLEADDARRAKAAETGCGKEFNDERGKS